VRDVASPPRIAAKLRSILDVQDIPIDRPARRSGRAWLLNPRRLEIVLTAAAYPGVHLRSASRLLLQPLPSLRYHVLRLERERFVATRRSGGRTSLFIPGMYPKNFETLLVAWEDRDAVPEGTPARMRHAFERLCHDKTAARLETFLGLLRRDDLHPEAEPLDRGRFRVTVDGPRARIRFVLPLDPIARG